MQLIEFSLLLENKSFNFPVVSIDYGGVSSTLMFAACESRQCENLTIIDDATLELTESFTVTLERTLNLNSRITLNPVDRDIEILDNDGRKYEIMHVYVINSSTV